jgi:hypothetical protein
VDDVDAKWVRHMGERSFFTQSSSGPSPDHGGKEPIDVIDDVERLTKTEKEQVMIPLPLD